MRANRAHSKNRRSHHALKGARLSVAKEAGKAHPRHKALLDGTPYRGRSVMDTTVKRAARKQKNTTPAPTKAKKEEVKEEKKAKKETKPKAKKTEKKETK